MPLNSEYPWDSETVEEFLEMKVTAAELVIEHAEEMYDDGLEDDAREETAALYYAEAELMISMWQEFQIFRDKVREEERAIFCTGEWTDNPHVEWSSLAEDQRLAIRDRVTDLHEMEFQHMIYKVKELINETLLELENIIEEFNVLHFRKLKLSGKVQEKE